MSSAFTEIVRTVDYPLFVLTTAVEGERSGCLIGFATQCSIHPPRFLACVSRKNHTFGPASRADHVVVHRLARHDRDLAELFGGETGDQVDKFARCRWRDGPERVPVLEDADSWFAGRVLERLDLGDHLGLLLEPVAGSPGDPDEDQLGFQEAKGIEPGHEP